MLRSPTAAATARILREGAGHSAPLAELGIVLLRQWVCCPIIARVAWVLRRDLTLAESGCRLFLSRSAGRQVSVDS